jgi:hypothetical protein
LEGGFKLGGERLKGMRLASGCGAVLDIVRAFARTVALGIVDTPVVANVWPLLSAERKCDITVRWPSQHL